MSRLILLPRDYELYLGGTFRLHYCSHNPPSPPLSSSDLCRSCPAARHKLRSSIFEKKLKIQTLNFCIHFNKLKILTRIIIWILKSWKSWTNQNAFFDNLFSAYLVKKINFLCYDKTSSVYKLYQVNHDAVRKQKIKQKGYKQKIIRFKKHVPKQKIITRKHVKWWTQQFDFIVQTRRRHADQIKYCSGVFILN